MKCISCGSELPEGARFCPSCGEKAGEAPAAGMKVVCRNCGSENDSDVQFCASCGNRLAAAPKKEEKAADQRPAPQAPPRKGKPVVRRRKIEAWHIAVVLSIITIVLIVLYYQERSRNSVETASASGPSPEQVSTVLSQLRDAATMNPNDPEARLHLANALQDAKKYPEAVPEYRAYLALRPRDVNARVDLGVCYFDMGELDSARSIMQTGLRIDPKHQMAMFNLGIVSLQSRNLEEARSWFEKTVAIDSTTDVGRRAKMMIQQHSF